MTCRHLEQKHSKIGDNDVYRCRKFGNCTLHKSNLKTVTLLPMVSCDTCDHFSEREESTDDGTPAEVQPLVAIAVRSETMQKTSSHPPIVNLKRAFDRATIINLKRRPDRLAQIKAELAQWPFVEPNVMEAVDGHLCKAPIGFREGDYAWACFQSHRRAVEDAINVGAKSLIVLEDDATLADGFADKTATFLQNVPDDWEVLFFGGRSEGPVIVAHGVARIVHIDRCHGYAARGRGLADLYNHWHQWHTGHCDWAISRWVVNYKAYCAVPWLIGQRGGWSDIQYVNKPAEWWHHGHLPSQIAATQAVGTEVHNILTSIGINANSCGSCAAMIAQMDQWGVSGCIQNRDAILARLRDRASSIDWSTKIKAAALSVKTGLAAEINWLDPAPGILQKAIDICANRA